ncbi:MAG: CPBP family intramembrane metalloprotease [Ignavibacterium sp.]|nr:CPBP family intramembrane metalloprotease [Ignavibacterium sp.]MBS4034224.1 CPBP family intramembrane metalloprotease [Ignavibacterium sp.]
MKVLSLLDFRWTIRSGEIKPGIILLASALIITLHRYFGSVEFAVQNYSEITSFYSAIFMFSTAFLMLGVIPFLMIKILFRDSLSEYGLSIGDYKSGFTFIVWLFPLITILLLYPSSNMQEMINYYPFDKQAGDSIFAFLRFELFRLVFFYSAWEFFFRGFMLFGLRKYVGDWLAICIQTIPSCLWHIGMPTGEIFASIIGGILFGVMALKTNSILYPMILHFLIGATLDFLIVVQL